MGAASRVGAMVVVFVVFAAGVFYFLGKGAWSAQVSEYYVRFDDAGGLNKGAQVLLSGVAIGSVAEITFDDQGRPLAKLFIRKDQILPVGTTALLPGSFIALGDKVVLLIAPKVMTGVLAPSNRADPIPGHLQGPLEGMMPNSAETVAELTKTMAAFRKILENQETQQNINHLLAAGATTADKFGGTAQRVNGLIDQNQEKLAAILTSVRASLKNLEAVSVAVARVAEEGNFEAGAMKLIGDLDAAVLEGQKMVGDLRTLTGDPENQKILKATLANVNEMTTSGAKVARDFETISASGIGIAKNAEEMTKNGAEASVKVNALLERANKLADQVEKLFDDAKGALKRVGGGDRASLFPKLETHADLIRESDPDRVRTDFNLSFDLGKDRFWLGMYDAFEGNKLNAQMARHLGRGVDLRYGVYASKPGLGVDYSATPRLGLRADLFGLNSTQLDLKARYDFGGGVHAWLGVDRALDRNTPSIGIGMSRK